MLLFPKGRCMGQLTPCWGWERVPLCSCAGDVRGCSAALGLQPCQHPWLAPHPLSVLHPPGTSWGSAHCSSLLQRGCPSPHSREGTRSPVVTELGCCQGLKVEPSTGASCLQVCGSLHLRSRRWHLKDLGCHEPSPPIALHSPDPPCALSWPWPPWGTHILASGVSGRGMRR